MNTKFALLLLMLFPLSFLKAQEPAKIYKISATEMFTEPISPLLCGNFMELGYGVQSEPMWSEMFFNRSFEYFLPYRDINKVWFDLYLGNTPAEGYEKEWSKFDWYHSGYEHNAWFAAPGKPVSPSFIEDASTFYDLKTPLCNVELQFTKEGSGHGIQALQLINNEKERWGALAQEAKYFKKGETYNFKGMMKAQYGTTKAEVRLYKQGTWDKPLAVIPISVLSNNFAMKSFSYLNKNFEGYVTFSLWIPANSSIVVDDFSMMPASNYYGWRKDVVDTYKKLKPTVVRFPGGCFSSFYEWKDAIGDFSTRKPSVSYFWGGLNSNDVGTAEFAMLCKAAKAEMSFCINMYHPSKRQYEVDFPNFELRMGRQFPEFMSVTEGAKSTAEWVAYCNLPAGKHTMADLRVKHGYTEPFGVRYWELDNEVHRWFESEDYAWATVIYSKAMKKVDPSIQIGLVSYGDRPNQPSYHDNIDIMLEIAGAHIDFLADRGDGDSMSATIINKLKIYNKTHGTNIKYCSTEWLAQESSNQVDVYNMARMADAETPSYNFSKWRYGLSLFKNLMAHQRLGNEMLFMNFSNLANTHSQSALESPKEGSYLTASGKVLELMSNTQAAWLLNFENYKAKAYDDYQVQAAWNADRTKLVLYVCNRTDSPKNNSFDFSKLNKNFSVATAKQLHSESPVAMETLKIQNSIKQEITKTKIKQNNSVYTVEVPAYSFTEIVIE
jgi:alpha-N-arabinofuranosidase